MPFDYPGGILVFLKIALSADKKENVKNEN